MNRKSDYIIFAALVAVLLAWPTLDRVLHKKYFGELRKKLHLDRMSDMNSKLQLVEGQADKLILDLLRDLYSGRHDPIQAMMLRDLYDLMEKVVDRCRDAGNVVAHIVLKYS